MNIFVNIIRCALAMLVLTFSFDSTAITIKVGVLAPEGTSWATNIKKMIKEVKKSTDNTVNFKVYFGGSQGDEPDVLRKIRIDQLNGGIFSGKTLGDINGDIRVIEIPFNFSGDRDKASQTLHKLEPDFSRGLEKNGFKNLGFFEIGQVYLVSNKEVPTVKSLGGVKIWSWEGYPIVMALIYVMSLVSVPLPLPDVLSSFSTGIIEAAYSPPLAIIALQWHTKIKYLVNVPISYSVGAFLVEMKQWNKIPVKYQKIVQDICNRYINEVDQANWKENQEALASLKSLGVKMIMYSDKEIKTGQEIRKKVIAKLKGKLFSEEIYKKLEKELNTVEKKL